MGTAWKLQNIMIQEATLGRPTILSENSGDSRLLLFSKNRNRRSDVSISKNQINFLLSTDESSLDLIAETKHDVIQE